MASSVSSQQDKVLVEANSSARIITLNRPKQLNAQSFQMIYRLLELFLVYEEDPIVKLVILKGKGRAFSVGGDVAALVRDMRADDWRVGANFFSQVFKLIYLIATYSKPQVSILNGIVMGGGAGISVHGRFRVATENTTFAMPEVDLGLFPDVAASYFLSRLPGFFGEYVGLTGSRLDGAEMLACGLATHFVPSAKLPMLEAALCNADSSDPVIISSIIDQYSEKPSLKEQSVYNRLDVIDGCFSQRTVEEIISALEREDVHHMDSWISATIQKLKKSSPTSLKIFLRSIREGRLQGVGQCLVREYRMVSHVLKGELSKDFFEGCRAILLDKDKNPNWEPSKLEMIDEGRVECYFSKVKHEEWEDLKLPIRVKFELPPYVIAKL
ncbi:3-hydroxyisobutyryl-CoA hydrolase 1 [Hibiscus syriacus]|uniref:3-hydroxyisobutyryl-CoA hydrolase n=1 Tax=Hibiscus syriacus TaxID=106335 RepID=A0A6A2Z1G6_HIBSY|nr:3-hydroxyisobutyryl-CoA hydrolase 1-like isoform X2 [Hibiscus syriacus]KAE8684955.1 3-hydroxyisobutyryl-CoA hydrolase 1 [Hibiscus syriacus]